MGRTVGYAEHGAAGMLTLFVRGVLCNWMVSTGVVAAMMSTSVSGKVITMWMPIMLFFYMGFEHSVVNMFLFPSGLMLGGDFSSGDYLVWNEIPTVSAISWAGWPSSGSHCTPPTPAPARRDCRPADASRPREPPTRRSRTHDPDHGRKSEAAELIIAARTPQGAQPGPTSPPTIERRPLVVAVVAALLGPASGYRPASSRAGVRAVWTSTAPVAESLRLQPARGVDPALTTDPTIYRFHEALAVYGPALKELIHEEFGDGIMSAINFRVDVARRAAPGRRPRGGHLRRQVPGLPVVSAAPGA